MPACVANDLGLDTLRRGACLARLGLAQAPAPTHPSPRRSTTPTAAKDENDAYFKGQIEACGYTFITDSKWTCSKQPPADDDWLTADFDDSHWERATWVRTAGWLLLMLA